MDKNQITYFGETDNRNKKIRFGIKAEDRSRHMYIIGKTGMGKSTVLENLAIQDIEQGNGLAFIDPHGKTADLLLDYIPQHRIKDVLYFAPFDLEHPISFNVMEDVGYEKRHLVANGLMSAFKKIWVDAWSARMEYILNNILLALLEYPDSTLIGVNRMLVDKEYRKKVVDNITDPSVKAFWVDEYAKYTDRFAAEAAPAIQNKIGQFVSNPLVRNIIGQPKSTFDLREVMDNKKILIINLSKGRVGEANANLLGSMLITKIYLAAMSRADASPGLLKTLPSFNLYVDEFQSFANESFADILSEARKYKLNLTIAHQYIEQMSEEVRAAVFGNVGTMVTFRVGSFDAEVLEKEFFPTFTKEHLVNLGMFQIYLKLMIDGVASAPFSATTMPPIEKPLISFKEDIIRNSRATYSRPRAAVEEDIRKWHEPIKIEAPKKKELEPINRFPKPANKKDAHETELRKALASMYVQNAPLDQKPEKPEELEKPKPEVRPEPRVESKSEPRPEPRPQPKPQQNQQKFPQKSDQKQQQNQPKKDSKAPSKENISALRNALAAVMKEEPRPEIKQESKPEVKPGLKPEPKQSEPKAQPVVAGSSEQPDREVEVPEEVLRRIFDVER